MHNPFRKEPTSIQITVKQPLMQPDQTTMDSLAMLDGNPGFRFLLQRLDLAASYLEARLRTERHVDIRSVDSIQQGIAWCKWVKTQLEAAQPKLKVEKRQAEAYEEELFKELDKQLVRLGTDNA